MPHPAAAKDILGTNGNGCKVILLVNFVPIRHLQFQRSKNVETVEPLSSLLLLIISVYTTAILNFFNFLTLVPYERTQQTKFDSLCSFQVLTAVDM
jgi:hypothetical protein